VVPGLPRHGLRQGVVPVHEGVRGHPQGGAVILSTTVLALFAHRSHNHCYRDYSHNRSPPFSQPFSQLFSQPFSYCSNKHSQNCSQAVLATILTPFPQPFLHAFTTVITPFSQPLSQPFRPWLAVPRELCPFERYTQKGAPMLEGYANTGEAWEFVAHSS
jgi:hypothetical protein